MERMSDKAARVFQNRDNRLYTVHENRRLYSASSPPRMRRMRVGVLTVHGSSLLHFLRGSSFRMFPLFRHMAALSMSPLLCILIQSQRFKSRSGWTVGPLNCLAAFWSFLDQLSSESIG